MMADNSITDLARHFEEFFAARSNNQIDAGWTCKCLRETPDKRMFALLAPYCEILFCLRGTECKAQTPAEYAKSHDAGMDDETYIGHIAGSLTHQNLDDADVSTVIYMGVEKDISFWRMLDSAVNRYKELRGYIAIRQVGFTINDADLKYALRGIYESPSRATMGPLDATAKDGAISLHLTFAMPESLTYVQQPRMPLTGILIEPFDTLVERLSSAVNAIKATLTQQVAQINPVVIQALPDGRPGRYLE